MKYDFDQYIDRKNAAGSFSSKWGNNERMAKMFLSETLPEDRLCFFVADMDFKIAPEIQAALKEVVDHGILGYSQAPEAYFAAVTRWMKDRFAWEINPEHIFIHRGAHTAIKAVIEKTTKPGDGVIVFQPTYYYRMDVSGTGRHYVGCRMNNDNGYYTIDWAKFEECCKEPTNTMVIIQQPHNPAGRIWTVEELTKIAEIARKYNVLILSDEVHMDIKRRGNVVEPAMKVMGPQGVITVTGINKTFNLAGLAVTNTIIEDEAILEKMGPRTTSATPFGYAACIAAYDGRCDEWVEQLNDYIDDVMDYVIDRIHKELPKVKVWKPEGTYILWLDFTDYGLTSEELDQKIAGECHIGFSDGAGLEPGEGELFRRMCLTSTKAVAGEAIDRLAKAFANL